MAVKPNTVDDTPVDNLIDQNTAPYPYVISLWKLFILYFLTLGLFGVYWFYKQWKSFYAVKNEKHGGFHIFLLSIFSGISSFFLFRRIAKEAKEVDPKGILRAVGLASTFLVINFLCKLPDPFWLVSNLSVLALLPVQSVINHYWMKKYGDKVVRSGFGVGNTIAAIIGAIFIMLVIYSTFDTTESTPTDTTTSSVKTTPSENVEVTPTKALSEFNESYRTVFIPSCTEEGGGVAYCECAADYLVTHYNESQLLQISSEADSDTTPQAITDAVDYCIDKYDATAN